MIVGVLICLFLSCVSGLGQSDLYGDEFHEELLLKQLPSGHVYSYFQFTTLWENGGDEPNHHCHLFPQSLSEVLHLYNVDEMHLSLTGGLWRHENWGYPVISAPPGAELWAWFKEGTEDVDKKWTLLSNALSGLFCASLNFINPQQSLNPKYSFAPLGAYASGSQNRSLLRYSTLPREIVCTENLTPFKKLLPCDSKKGLSSLLNAGNIHNANYHSLGIHVRPQCKDVNCQQTVLELRQTVSLVYDLIILGPESRDWSFRKLFGVGLAGSCPLAASSRIYVDTSSNGTSSIYTLTPEPTEFISSNRGGYNTLFAVYDIKKTNIINMFSISSTHKGPRVQSLNSPPVLHATRYIVGYGQEHGGIVTKIHNNHWKDLDIILFENIPWFLPIYYHTLRVTTNEGKQVLKPYKKHYIPGRDRSRPYALELLVSLPPRSVVEIYVEFDYSFLKWQEYPPDANHGFYIGAAVITSVLPHTKNYTGIPIDGSTFSSSINASRDTYPVTLHTEILLVTLPTPDFSMPYNVICLACTVVALAFGPLHNHTTKRLQMLDPSEETKGLLTSLRMRLKSFICKSSEEKEEISVPTKTVKVKSKESASEHKPCESKSTIRKKVKASSKSST
ncbi:GPI transamidase component PIG-T [Frankliniella fusca]|uniref:GPI transamidase component PIG-T n=1 Tax=Frankliniella fusca TaxID=407009 RepID=A0AAE1HLE0_9NEOP|nr:GPI transamidase component PIG-T [Frankliniella fusca]